MFVMLHAFAMSLLITHRLSDKQRTEKWRRPHSLRRKNNKTVRSIAHVQKLSISKVSFRARNKSNTHIERLASMSWMYTMCLRVGFIPPRRCLRHTYTLTECVAETTLFSDNRPSNREGEDAYATSKRFALAIYCFNFTLKICADFFNSIAIIHNCQDVSQPFFLT